VHTKVLPPLASLSLLCNSRNRRDCLNYLYRLYYLNCLDRLMHITGGQLARGPKIISVWHSNTVKGGQRGRSYKSAYSVIDRTHDLYVLALAKRATS
jgi:hypothetical protein